MKRYFTIASAYQWGSGKEESHSKLAIKTLAENIKKRFTGPKKENYKINYKRLRASAGKTMLNSIIRRIEESNVLIIDLSTDNGNVYIETGIALAIQVGNPYLSVYFIREQRNDVPLPKGIPSDLQGYFISEYSVNAKRKVTFKDNNSLRMSIESDVKDYFNSIDNSFEKIDEVGEYD